MYKSRSNVLGFPYFPWLLGVYPVLFLYSENLGLVFEHELPQVILGVLIATTILYLSANQLLKDRYKTALLLGTSVLFFSLSGHLYELIFMPRSLFVWTVMIAFVAAIVLLLLHRYTPKHLYRRATTSFNLIALALLIWPTYTIVADKLNTPAVSFDLLGKGNAVNARTSTAKVNDSPIHPDIYYIIPDGYPSDSWLREAMGYDNSGFTEALEARGFKVIEHAQSNYGATLMSLASILNMEYFNYNDTQYRDVDLLRLSIADSKVARTLLQSGYTYVQFLSGYLLPSPIADINRDFTRSGPIDISYDLAGYSATILAEFGESPGYTSAISQFYQQSFISLYLETTMLRILKSVIQNNLKKSETSPYGFLSPDRFLDTIDEFESIAAMPEATFTIVHLMKPHEPTSFDAQGNIIENIWYPSHDEYIAEFGFVNSKFLQMIDSILQGSQHPPIIIFLADHATTYGEVWNSDERLTHFDVYAAYYLPEAYSVEFRQPYTSINTFPVILNEVFSTTFELQDNRLYDVPKGYEAPFEQVDVTEAFANWY